MTYTILRPSAFMDSHAHQFIGAPLVRTGKVVIPGSGRNPINLIAAADVARYVVIGLTDSRARHHGGRSCAAGGCAAPGGRRPCSP